MYRIGDPERIRANFSTITDMRTLYLELKRNGDAAERPNTHNFYGVTVADKLSTHTRNMLKYPQK
jgi:hypothetical protein